MVRAFTELTFTPTVLDLQKEDGSSGLYAPFMEADADRRDRLGDAEAEFIHQRDGFYQASVAETGWPYVQFKGGPRGFLNVLDEKTIGYADYRGNRQHLSAGNLTADSRVSLILMDYPNRRRLKLWGRARLTSRKDAPDLVQSLHVDGYKALPERAILITVEAFDWNCPAHIPQRMTLEELEPQITPFREKMEDLIRENTALKEELERLKQER
ncbi:pyridoxamine 5'-phosphate oxidase family protein [Coralliovum pocilloporae]|uniref:pyridoxamine 5'-phosphate oxidase family protein n=1 Tax=Coralliovum pocilloporae TaxID=3066369 RepID=UPI003306ED76